MTPPNALRFVQSRTPASRPEALPEGPEPVDWQGVPLDCTACQFRSRLDTGQCGLGWACVHDRYAKRIERFFLLNPELADECLRMPYFETRINAARVATLFRLPALLNDEDPGVRAMAILRLPVKHAQRRIKDPDRRVRIAVAHRLPVEDLLPVLSDPDSYVRQIAVRRADPNVLPTMIGDEDPEIRRQVARRIRTDWLNRFIPDPDPLVRREAAERTEPSRLHGFARDEDMRVRYVVAERAPPDVLHILTQDPEDVIRETAAERLAEFEREPTNVNR
ncbi:MAG: 4Fe4S-binding leucine-rich repeat protein [Pseudomonadota bacterium]